MDSEVELELDANVGVTLEVLLLLLVGSPLVSLPVTDPIARLLSLANDHAPLIVKLSTALPVVTTVVMVTRLLLVASGLNAAPLGTGLVVPLLL